MDTNDQEVTPQTEVEETTTEPTETKQPEKAVETPEAKRARLVRQLARLDKQLGKSDDEADDEPEPKAQTKSNDLGFGEKAFLKSYGISGSDELSLVKTWLKRTGDDLDTLVEDEIFKAKLNGLREARATKEALPTNTKRSAATTRDHVDYWLSKGELPPKDQAKLRREVVNARIEASRNGTKFYNS